MILKIFSQPAQTIDIKSIKSGSSHQIEISIEI